MPLDAFNRLSIKDAHALLGDCCAATTWVQAMTAQRPYASRDSLHSHAQSLWPQLQEADWLEAFSAHPKIGDVKSLHAKYASTKAIASGEQAGAQTATIELLHQLKRLNEAYEQKFGFIFIVCATGKSAAEMLALLEHRLPNDRDKELLVAACEQTKITHLRLDKLI